MSEIALLIFLMALVTFLPRVIPILALSRRKLPEAVERWLSYVPVAVLSALLAPALFFSEGILTVTFSANPALWVSLPVVAIAILSRNLFITVLSGMLIIALVRHFC